MITTKEIYDKWSDGNWHFLGWDEKEIDLAHKFFEMKIAKLQALPYGDRKIKIKKEFLKNFKLEDIIL